MPPPEPTKVRPRNGPQIGSKTSTTKPKKPSTNKSSISNSKISVRSNSSINNSMKKISEKQKSSVSSTKTSTTGSLRQAKPSTNSPQNSNQTGLGLTQLLAAASAAVAVSPGVMRRGIPDNCKTDNTIVDNINKEEKICDELNSKSCEIKNQIPDSKNIILSEKKYNTFARAMEMLPAFDDIEDEDDEIEIEVPEILRDNPENLEPIHENETITTFTKNILNQTPANTEKCKAIESKMLQNRRHYKKDSRFVLDLYTLTFDEDESVDTIDTRGPVQTEDCLITTNDKNQNKISLDLSKICLKENSSYVTAKNNYHDFVSLEDYLVDYMSSKSCSFNGDTFDSSTTSDASLPPKSDLNIQDDEENNKRSFTGIR